MLPLGARAESGCHIVSAGVFSIGIKNFKDLERVDVDVERMLLKVQRQSTLVNVVKEWFGVQKEGVAFAQHRMESNTLGLRKESTLGLNSLVLTRVFRGTKNTCAACIQNQAQIINHNQHLSASVRCRLLLICGNHNKPHTEPTDLIDLCEFS